MKTRSAHTAHQCNEARGDGKTEARSAELALPAEHVKKWGRLKDDLEESTCENALNSLEKFSLEILAENNEMFNFRAAYPIPVSRMLNLIVLGALGGCATCPTL